MARLAEILILACLVAQSQGDIVVDYNAQPGLPTLSTPSGEPLPKGNIVSLGTFPLGYDPVAHDPLSWQQNWSSFDQAIIGGANGTLPAGRFSRSASGPAGVTAA